MLLARQVLWEGMAASLLFGVLYMALARQGEGNERAWSLCRNATMVLRPAADAAFHAVQVVHEQQVPGAIVEVGVWRGGMSCYMAMADQHQVRELWLYDTFEGLPAPSEKDDDKSKALFRQINSPGFKFKHHVTDGKWCKAALEDVQRTMQLTGYDETKLHFIKGKVEDTLTQSEAQVPSSIAVLRLDTDWYESTRMELEVFWPRLSPGGWLYLDDYTTWGGAKRAVDEWLAKNNWTTHAHRVGAFPGNHSGKSKTRFSLWKNHAFSRTRPFMSDPF